MGELEDLYDRKAAQEELQKRHSEVDEYNRYIDIINRYGQLILEKYLENPPANCMFVVIDGERQVSWHLTSEPYDHSWSIGILPDGRFVQTGKASQENIGQIETFERVGYDHVGYIHRNYVRDFVHDLWQEAHTRGIEIDFDRDNGCRLEPPPVVVKHTPTPTPPPPPKKWWQR